VESNFGLAELKREGSSISYSGPVDENTEETTWVERSVPKRFEEEIHKLINTFLKQNKGK